MNVLFKNGKCFFRDPENRVVAIEIEDDGQYELKVKSVNQQSLFSAVDTKDQLWLQRMGHKNYRSLKLMHRLNMVHGLPKVSVHNCLCELVKPA